MPIANCWLEHNYNEVERKTCLIGYFVDIFSNIYTFNLTTYFEYRAKIPGRAQPIKYKVLHINSNYDLLNNDYHLIHMEYPMLLAKHEHIITTINLRGVLKIFDCKQNEDKSWIHTLLEPSKISFSLACLAATCNNSKSVLGNVIVLVFNNKLIPYVFVNCHSL